jgi:uncharacterized protein (DUF58 family)
MAQVSKYLDPRVLGRVNKLDFKARKIVEGFMLGRHRSPFHGISVEFADHREYTPGDDLRHLDWKVYAKSDRFFVKRYEADTNLRSYFLLDCSNSMTYRSGKNISKLEYGCYMVASLAYLLSQQQDAVGLMLFSNDVDVELEPGSSPAHLRRLFHALENAKTQPRTDVGGVMNKVAGRMKARGLGVILSDLFDDPAQIMLGLHHFWHRKHDTVLFHLLDPEEVNFNLAGTHVFHDLEGADRFACDPRDLREAYLAEIQAHIEEIRTGCRKNGIDYVQVLTSEPLDVALSSYLSLRSGK